MIWHYEVDYRAEVLGEPDPEVLKRISSDRHRWSTVIQMSVTPSRIMQSGAIETEISFTFRVFGRNRWQAVRRAEKIIAAVYREAALAEEVTTWELVLKPSPSRSAPRRRRLRRPRRR